MRSHPVLLATTAATVGVLLGGFIAVQLLGTPVKRDDNAKPAQTALETKAPPHIAETTGSASPDTFAKADCDQQTWPNLTRDCMKNGGAPATPSDSVVRTNAATGETQPPQRPVPPPAGPTPAPTSTASGPPPAPAPVAATAVAVPAAPAETKASLQTAEKPEAKPKHFAKKAKHMAKKPIPMKQQLNDDDDDRTIASDDADDSDDSGDRVDRRPVRSPHPHIVSRWTEREYDVPDDEGDGRRRVVIRRGGDNPFSALFGGLGD